MLDTLQVNDYSFESIQQLNDNLQYIDYIKANYVYKQVTIEPATSYRFQGNFFGLLRSINVSPSLFLYTLYLNNYSSPFDFGGDRTTLTIATKPPIPSS